MSYAKRLDELAPGAIVPLTWDFTSDFDEAGLAAFAITGTPRIVPSVDTSLRRGTDSGVASMLVGSPQVAGKVVMQMVTGRTDGVDYKVRCEVDVNSTPQATLFKTSILPVRTQ